MAGTLRISRRTSILDRYRQWDIVLDGQVVGGLVNGQCRELPVRSGRHTVRVGHRWLASPMRAFSVRNTDTIEFECRPRPHPMVWIPYGLASLVRHDLFIVLEPMADVGLVDART